MVRENEFDIRFTTLVDIEDKWKRLQSSAVMTPYQNYSWIMCWIEHVGSNKDYSFLIVEGFRRNDTYFILPLMVKRKFGLTICTWIGGKEQNTNGGLYDPKFLLENSGFLENVISKIRALHPEISLFLLQKQPKMIGDTVNPSILPTISQYKSNVLYINTMGDNFDQWERSERSRTSRNRMNRQWKKLEEQFGRSNVERVQSEPKLDMVLKLFEHQRSDGWTTRRVPNPFANAKLIKFLNAAIIDSANSNYGMQCHILKSGEVVHAIHFGLFTDDYYSGFAISFENTSFEFSPGVLLQREILKIAHNQGIRCFDLGLGNSPFKHAWTEPTPVYDSIIPATPAGLIGKVVIISLARTREIFKIALNRIPKPFRNLILRVRYNAQIER